MMVRSQKAQSTLEYVIVLAAVVAAIITFATGTLRGRIVNSFNYVTNEMQNVIQRIDY